MKKIILLLPFLLLGLCTSQAQDYQTALGLRLGYPVSISAKHFITDSGAIELALGTRGRFNVRTTNISAAFQKHSTLDVLDIDGLSWYWGFGAGVYFWKWRSEYLLFGEQYRNTSFALQGYAGLDYTFDGVPINISLDWIPTINLSGYLSGFGAGYGALTVRYVLR